MRITLTDLNKQYDESKGKGYEYFAIVIETAGNIQPEVIINHKENFKSKMAYINKAYNEDLTLKAAPNVISIKGSVFANSYSAVYRAVVENI